jgi:hypothetical protein
MCCPPGGSLVLTEWRVTAGEICWNARFGLVVLRF